MWLKWNLKPIIRADKEAQTALVRPIELPSQLEYLQESQKTFGYWFHWQGPLCLEAPPPHPLNKVAIVPMVAFKELSLRVTLYWLQLILIKAQTQTTGGAWHSKVMQKDCRLGNAGRSGINLHTGFHRCLSRQALNTLPASLPQALVLQNVPRQQYHLEQKWICVSHKVGPIPSHHAAMSKYEMFVIHHIRITHKENNIRKLSPHHYSSTNLDCWHTVGLAHGFRQ